MYIRETRQKRADGSFLTHSQLVESVWNPEKKKSETRVIYNFGRVDSAETRARMLKLANTLLRRCSLEEVAEATGQKLVAAYAFGDVFVLDEIWKRLGIPQIVALALEGRKIEFPLERALFAMVANRACAPISKLGCHEEWLREDVIIPGTQELALQHLYRAMDVLDSHKEIFEKGIYNNLANLFNIDVQVVFYDTTSIWFEIDEEDRPEELSVEGEPSDPSPSDKAIRKRGKGKGGHDGIPQLVIGLVMTRDGYPVRHWVFPGNTVDVSTVATVKADLKGWNLTRCVFVGDAGMVSADNLGTLAASGGKYIVSVSTGGDDEVHEQVLMHPGRFKDVAENLRVKEVVLGEGERRRRYILCFNPMEAERQKAHREQILKELEAEIESLRYADEGEGPSRRVCALRASRRYGKYLLFKGQKLEINKTKVKEEEKRDGKFVLRTNDDTLLPEDLALAYKQLSRVEDCWRTLKSGIRIRPVYHHAEHRMRAHIALCVMALLLERVVEKACGDTWRNIRNDLRKVQLGQLSGPDGTTWQVTEPRPEARIWLSKLDIPRIPQVIRMS